MTTEDLAGTAGGGEPAADDGLGKKAIDYLVELARALHVPPALTDDGELVYYRLVRDRLVAVVHSLRAVLADGVDRALPRQTVWLRGRVAELSTDAYEHTVGNWDAEPERPWTSAPEDRLRTQVNDFLTALLDLLDVPDAVAAGDTSSQWLMEDRVNAADIQLTILLGTDLAESLPEQTAGLRAELADFQGQR